MLESLANRVEAKHEEAVAELEVLNHTKRTMDALDVEVSEEAMTELMAASITVKVDESMPPVPGPEPESSKGEEGGDDAGTLSEEEDDDVVILDDESTIHMKFVDDSQHELTIHSSIRVRSPSRVVPGV